MKIQDARTDSVGTVLKARVAIIGAGAAGLSLARRLANRSDGVLLVESGGLKLEGGTQRLAAGRSIGVPYFDLLATRLRYYGGTTNHWTGYCRVGQPIDLEGRPELGILPWPVDLPGLMPYLKEAAGLLDVSADFFNQKGRIEAVGLPGSEMVEGLPGFSGAVETRTFQISPSRLVARTVEDELASLPGLTQVLNLNVVELIQNGARRIDRARARTLTGKEVEIQADYFILACHGIENARILLSSTSQSPAGVGNGHDNVGRHFSEHAVVENSTLIPSSRFPDIYDFNEVRRLGIDIHLALSEASMRKHGVLNNYVRFLRTGFGEQTEQSLTDLGKTFMRPFDAEVAEDMRTVLDDMPGVAGAALGSIHPRLRWKPYFKMRHRFEQAPNPLSRVVLSARKNAIGQPEADLDWHLTDLDVKTVTVGRDLVARELSALGLGRVQMGEITRATMEKRLGGTHHQMGTTRMSKRPEDGVVDFDSRVHDLDNLYIAGSSVFPNPSDASPTLTLIAMAMRLADHLQGRLV